MQQIQRGKRGVLGLASLTSLASLAGLISVISAPVAANGLLESWREYGQVWHTGKTTYGLDIDNDSLLLQDRDGLYSSGGVIRVSTHLADASQTRIAGWHLGQDQYTPQDVKLLPQQISPKDHPYAAWLYTGWFSEAHQLDGGYWKSSIDFGCIGPCARGEQVQKGLHRLINQPEPQGWSRQVKNEFGVQLGMAWAPRRYALGRSADFTPSVQARFGNIYADASVSGVLRLGSLNNLPQQATNHLFLRADARGVGYNASLQGGYFSKGNVHTVSPKPWVGEVELGWVWHGSAWATQVGVVRRSNEIKRLSNSEGAQNFARLQFSYTP